jgi:carbonic anhydrase
MRKNGMTLLAAALLAAAAPAAAQSVDPDQSLKMMLDGNKRYVSGAATRPHQSEARRQEVAKGQHCHQRGHR